ncbi:MAG: hypothetical protein HY698_05270 [Deltaproteobacteria bacterium]|nr:hypothetical protein [Deltaproteobacteria bacterium]
MAKGGRPTASDLTRAVRRGDPEEIERIVRRMGTPAVAAIINDRASEHRLAAIEAAPLCQDSWTLLTFLVPVLSSPDDHPRAEAAARAAAEIARAMARDRVLVERMEPPPDELERARHACGVVARRRGLPSPLRVHAMACAFGLASVLRSASECKDCHVAQALLDDPDPEIRRMAAWQVVDAGTPEAWVRLRDVALADADALVAAAATAALCTGNPDARALLSKDGTMARIRALMADPNVNRGLRAAIRRCLPRREKRTR